MNDLTKEEFHKVVNFVLSAKTMSRAVKEKDWGFAEHLLMTFDKEITSVEKIYKIEDIIICA